MPSVRLNGAFHQAMPDQVQALKDLNFFHTNTGVIAGTILLVLFWLLMALLARRGRHLGAVIARAIRGPLLLGLSASLYLGWLTKLISTQVKQLDGRHGMQVSASITIIAVCWAVIRLGHSLMDSQRFESWLQLDDPKDRAMAASFLERIFIILVIVIGVGALMVTYGVPATALAALGGGAGVGLAFGTQNISQNFFSGFMLFFNRPFKEGDWICSNGMEGTVENIGWYHTRLRSFDRRPMYIPNAVFATNTIINPGRMYNRRIKADIGLRYEDIDAMQPVSEQVRQMLQQHPEIDQNQVILVNFNAWESSSLNLLVYCFTKTTHWKTYLDIQQDVFLKIAAIVRKNNADFAFNCTTLYPAPNLSKDNSIEQLCSDN